MRSLLEFLIVFVALQERVESHFSDTKNETAYLNQDCDKTVETADREGNLGQTHLFPWLGILRVHIHAHQSFQVALTGVVLVTNKYAIGDAVDIAKIPMTTMRLHSQLMFILDDKMPIFCKVVDYMVHPEYDITTKNTVAILEIDDDGIKMRAKTICWPYQNFNTSNQLFLIGYTDERQLLEKTMYQVQYVDKKLCYEFYKRSKLASADLRDPINYQCAFAVYSRSNCTWETGRVVASNATGYWTLIGLIVSGPGCSAPARFLDITAFMPWLVTSMNLDWNNDYETSQDIVMRKSGVNLRGEERNVTSKVESQGNSHVTEYKND
ncbi:proclotting enzyme-like [Phthorimaea operculella]|nr:proclotting enzyme-like [Phthorimaea operculella]